MDNEKPNNFDPKSTHSDEIDHLSQMQDLDLDAEHVEFSGFTDQFEDQQSQDHNLSHVDDGQTAPLDRFTEDEYAYYGGHHHMAEDSIYIDDHDQQSTPSSDLEEPSYLQEERQIEAQLHGADTILPKNNFDLSAITLADLTTKDPALIKNVFELVAQRDEAGQIEFFEKLGLNFENDADLKLLGELNQIQIDQASINALQQVHEHNSTLPIDERLYTTAETKLYLSEDHPDFLLSTENNPFEAIQVAEQTLFDFETKSFVSQPYYGLSLKGVSQENSLNFLSHRQYEVELLINQNQAIREAKQQLYNEVTAAPNTFFSEKFTTTADILAFERQIKNFCLIRGISDDDAKIVPKTITMDQWQANDDHTAAVQQTAVIHYLEFDPKIFTKEILQLLETKDHNDQLEAAILLKQHLGDDYLNKHTPPSENSNGQDAGTTQQKSTLNLSGGAESKEKIAANTVAAKNFKEIKKDDLLDRPALAQNNGNYPRTVADELAAMSAKSIAATMEAVKKAIKLIIAAIRALFNKDKGYESLKEIWNTPVLSDFKTKGIQQDQEQDQEQKKEEAAKSNLVEPTGVDAKATVSKEALLPLLNDPYTAHLNKERVGLSLEEFDQNIAKVYSIDGEQYIVVDVVNAQAVEGPDSDSKTPYLKLVKEADLPPQVEGSNSPTPITPFYLESIEDKIKFLSIEELNEGIKNNKVAEFEGQFFEPISSQYLEQARLFLGAELPFGQEQSQTSQQDKLSYKEQFALKAYQSGLVISKQFSDIKTKFSKVFDLFKKPESVNPTTPDTKQTLNNEINTMENQPSYIQHDSEFEQLLQKRHEKVSFAEIEQYVGMVYQDDKTNQNMAVLDIASDSGRLEKCAIVIPLDKIQHLDIITEKDVLCREDVISHVEVIHLYELEAADPIDDLNIKHKFDPEYLDKLKQNTINNSADETNIYAQSAAKQYDIANSKIEGKLAVLGTLIKTEKGQFVVLTSDNEGPNAIWPEYKAVPITQSDRQMTTEDIINAGIQTIPRKNVLEWHTPNGYTPDNNQITYLDPEVFDAFKQAIEEKRDMDLVKTLSDLQPTARLNAIGATITTTNGDQYISLMTQSSGQDAAYYAVKMPDEQTGSIDGNYIQEHGVQIIDPASIAHVEVNHTQKQILSQDIYMNLVSALNNGQEEDFMSLLSGLDQKMSEIRKNLELDDKAQEAQQDQFIQQLQQRNLDKAHHLDNIYAAADQLQNSDLKAIVTDAVDTLKDPFNAKNEMLSQQFVYLNQRLDTLQQDLTLQASNYLQDTSYKSIYDQTDDHIVLPTAYGQAEFLNFNSTAPEVVEFNQNEVTGHFLDNFNRMIEETGEVELALQKAKAELITDHYMDAIHEDVSLHRLDAADIEAIQLINQEFNAEFQLTGQRFEAFQPGLNHSTSNHLDFIQTEKAFVSEVLANFSSELENELARRNDRSNDQTLG